MQRLAIRLHKAPENSWYNSDMTPVYCRGCRNELAADARYCSKCGHDQLSKLEPQNPAERIRELQTKIRGGGRLTEAETAEMDGLITTVTKLSSAPTTSKLSVSLQPNVCPICKNMDQIRAVPAIVRDGSWTATTFGEHSTQAYTSSGHYAGTAHGTSMHTTGGATTLACILGPPAAPAQSIPMGLVIGIPLLMVPIFGIISHINGFIIWGSIVAGIFLLWGILSYPKIRKEYETQAEQYGRLMIVYNRLIYCGRCDVVTDPLSSRSERTDRWRSLLSVHSI